MNFNNPARRAGGGGEGAGAANKEQGEIHRNLSCIVSHNFIFIDNFILFRKQ